MRQRIFAGFFFLCLLLLPLMTSAQFSDFSRSRPQNEPTSLSQRLWYGGGFNLGFSGNGITNLFQFGLSPMVGFKLFEPFSVGPRVAVTYNHYRARTGNGNVDSANPISWAVSAFARYKIIPSIFGQIEFEVENEPLISIDINEIFVSRREQNNLFIGGGYTSSQGPGSWGYELVLLFNLNQSQNTVDLPYVLRLGLTYNF